MSVSKSVGARGLLAAAVALLLPLSALAEGRFIVKFRDGAKGKAALSAAGARIVKELGPQNAAAAHIPDAALAGLRNNPSIEFIEEDAIRQPLAQSTPYGIPMVQADQVWASATGANRKVCVIDSGLYTGHEDHNGNTASGYPSGWNSDLCGHGTHVAGTIAALNNTVGVVGVLPNGADLFIVKVFGDDCSWSYVSDLVDATNKCADAGANVINMSLGGGRASRLEQSAFDSHWANGIISVAAAGNGGNTNYSYPASYTSVISVAAVDSTKTHASFSQVNDQVDLAAPGVAVNSTVGWKETNTLSDSSNNTWSGTYIDGATRGTASGTIVDGKYCDFVGSWGGAVVLCQRGNVSFATKVANVEAGGGKAAVIYNNTAGDFFGTLNGTSKIPAIGISDTAGAAALNSVNETGTVTSTVSIPDSGYEAWDGTSMATPHVAGVVALVWSYNTGWSNTQVRDALEKTAQDLGATGRDNYYGHGLVQAKAALDYLNAGGSGGGGGGGGTTGISLSASGYKNKGTKYVDLAWSGATSTSVDVFRDGGKVTTTANDGAHTDGPLGKGGGSYTYKVCEAGTTTCSADVTVTF